MRRHGWFILIIFFFYFGINRIDMQTCTNRMGTQQLFLWAIPNVCYCENKFAIETMRTLTMKLFLSVFPPISGYCKQECPEHAWPATHCGRNFGLSSASGLRSDTRSADARSPFSAGCAALCVHARFHVLEPGLTTCAHTPKENSTSTKRLESYKKETLLTFYCALGFSQKTEVQEGWFSCRLWPEKRVSKVTAGDDPCRFPKHNHLDQAKKRNV